jgi:hypothetical protein
MRTLFLLSLCVLSVHAAGLELVSTEMIWDKGDHNAFTDLIRFKDRWVCTFRESEAHVGGDGKIRVIESKDGAKWESAALIAEAGTDLRDPKLSITPDGRLMIVAGGSIYAGTKVLKGRQPRVMFSKDAHQWTVPQRVLVEGEWLWRVTWHKGHAYGVSYQSTPPNNQDWLLTLFESTDGVAWNKVANLPVTGRPNETTVRFLKNGEMMALVRCEAPGSFAQIGTSKPPYKDWKFTSAKHAIGGPNFLQLPDGRLLATGRDYREKPKHYTGAGFFTAADGYMPELRFPSAGDNSYAGMAWRNGMLWMSYYSSHEGKSKIYLAKVKVPK